MFLMNILIVSKMSNDIICLMKGLQNYAIRMDCISNGFAALQAMKKHRYYTVIISADVENRNGIFIAKQLQKENPNIKILIMSDSQISRLDQNRCLERRIAIFLGANRFRDIYHEVERWYGECFQSLHP